MIARELVAALGGRWHDSYGMTQCIAHDDGRTPALKISDDDRKSDGIDLHCFGGCDWRDVKAALRERGLLPGSTPSTMTTQRRRRRPPSPEPVGTDNDNIKAALQIWREAQPAADTLVAPYLKHRAITVPPPPSLRFHPNLTHRPTGTGFPAMVAGVQGQDGTLAAIHRTYLLPDGTAKANISTPKMALGSLGTGAVRLAKAGPILGLAEGIETGLSAQQIFNVPCWAALGSRLDRVWLPDVVRHVVIYADNGDAGLEAAHKAIEAFTGLQRRVTLRQPPENYDDWNDALQALEREQAA